MRFFAYLKVKAPSSSNAVAHNKCVLPETRLFLPRHSGVATRSALFLAWVATPGTRNTERALVNLRDVTQYIAYRRFQSIYCLYYLVSMTPIIRTGFEVFECQFQSFERELKHSNSNSNHSNGNRSIQMPIPTIRTGFEAFECQLQPFERHSRHSNANSNHLNGFKAFECQFQPFEWESKHSNASSNHSNGIRMPIPTIQTGLEAFECQFQPFEQD